MIDFIKEEEYDTDSLKDDIDGQEVDINYPYPDSNLCLVLKQSVSHLKQYFNVYRPSIDGIIDILTSKCNVPYSKALFIIKELQANEYDSDSLYNDIHDEQDKFNRYQQSNLFTQPTLLNHNSMQMKKIRQYFNIKGHDDDQLTPFTFGQDRFYYWDHYKGWENYQGRPRYKSLKDETLNNKIHVMQKETWNIVLNKAYMYTHCNEGKSIEAKDYKGLNTFYEIPAFTPMSMSHMMVILMYTNYTDLQHDYKKIGCRESDGNNYGETLREKNKEIGHWYRLFFESVEIYGHRTKQRQIFYTGMKSMKYGMVFPTFTPYFRCPISTTIEKEVAYKFTESQGIILKLTPSGGGYDYFFNCEWCSDHPKESERIFAKAKFLQIDDIMKCSNCGIGYNHQWISCLRLFSSIFSGHYIIRDHLQKGNEVRLLSLIRNYNANNGVTQEIDYMDLKKIKVPIYIQQLFYFVVQQLPKNKDEIKVIESMYTLFREELQHLLFTVDEIPAFIKRGTASRKVVISPLLCSLEIAAVDIAFMSEYKRILNGDFLDKLKRTKDEWMYLDDKIDYRMKCGDIIKISIGIKRKANRTEDMGMIIKIEEIPDSYTKVDGVLSLFVEEVNYIKNEWRLKNMRKGGDNQIFIFEDKYLDNLDVLSLKIAFLFHQ